MVLVVLQHRPQEPQQRQETLARGHHERGNAGAGREIRVRPAVEQQLRRRLLPVDHCLVKRGCANRLPGLFVRVPDVCHRVYIAATINQTRDHLEVSAYGRSPKTACLVDACH